MKSDHLPSSGGKHTEKRPAAPPKQNSNANLYERASRPPGASGDMAKDGYGKKSM